MFEIKRMQKDFFRSGDIFSIAKNLLGKVICSNIGSEYVSGIIVEVECYNGKEDKACHAYNNKRTARTEVMFQEGGVAYIYLCYGVHHLLNIVTGRVDEPTAILIRAIDPINGVDIMLRRREKKVIDYSLTSGPGSLSKALGITTDLSGLDLTTSSKLWIEDRGYDYEGKIESSPRIGVEYAQEDAELHYRFYLSKNKWVSKMK